MDGKKHFLTVFPVRPHGCGGLGTPLFGRPPDPRLGSLTTPWLGGRAAL